MVLLAVDNNGLTNELARYGELCPISRVLLINLCSLLLSSRFLTKLTKDPRNVMVLDLSEGKPKGNTRGPGGANPTKDLLVAQLKRLYRDVDSVSLRNSLPNIFSEMEMLQLKVIYQS